MSNPNYGVYSYIHPINCTVNIYHTGNVADTVNVVSLNTFITQTNDNIKKYNNKIYDQLIVNVWNPDRDDMPRNTTQYNVVTCKQDIVTQGIGSYAGLSSGYGGWMDLNGTYTKDDFSLSNLISHEIGHIIRYKINQYQDSNDVITPEWNRIRCIDATTSTPPIELIAEDFRCLTGSNLAQGYDRGDQKSPKLVKGLKGLMLIWSPVTEYVNQKRKEGYTILPSDARYKYSDTNFDYFGVQLKLQKTVGTATVTEYRWIDTLGTWTWTYKNSKWQWEIEKKF